MNKTITKQMLINWRVEVRRENGVDVIYQYRLKSNDYQKLAFYDENGKSTYKQQKPYKYVNIALYDEDKIYDNNHWSYKYRFYAVHRVIYAWYKGECPVEFDVDHIDNNRENNNIENLQLLDRRSNNDKKIVSRNQWNYNLTDEEILEKRKNKPYIYSRELHKYVKNPDYQKEQ